MPQELKIAMIGLDTSHSVEFTKLLQSPDAGDAKAYGIKVVTCLRFPTPFQTEEGQDQRQAVLESCGVKVTKDFDEAVADCDGIMIEINDPAYHLEYFRRCAGLGKPIYLDKPMADNKENGAEILKLIKENNIACMSASPLRFSPEVIEACNSMQTPQCATIFGTLGIAPAGSSIVWYGVHGFDMLQRAMGRGARSVTTMSDEVGIVAVVEYDDARRGVVELAQEVYVYGGVLRDEERMLPFSVNLDMVYSATIVEIANFFNGKDVTLEMEDTFEVMAMLDAAERSFQTGEKAVV